MTAPLFPSAHYNNNGLVVSGRSTFLISGRRWAWSIIGIVGALCWISNTLSRKSLFASLSPQVAPTSTTMTIGEGEGEGGDDGGGDGGNVVPIAARAFPIWHEARQVHPAAWCQPTTASSIVVRNHNDDADDDAEKDDDDDDDDDKDDANDENALVISQQERQSLRLQNTGLRFTKIPKCASSTGAAVSVRIARAVAAAAAAAAEEAGEQGIQENYNNNNNKDNNNDNNNNNTTLHCHYMVNHLKLSEGHFIPREKERSFLWTIVRRPNARLLSLVFFKEISRQQKEPTEKVLLSLLQRKITRDFNRQVKYARPHGGATTNDVATARDVADIMAEYDFVGVAERMEETLAVLQILLDLKDPWDLIVMDSKIAGGYDDGRSKYRCVKLVPSFSTRRITQLLQEEHAVPHNYDYLLYQTANASLNQTMQALGMQRVQETLAKFRVAHQMAQDKCQSQIRPPCDGETGQKQKSNCYFGDWGCGYPCVDRLAAKQRALAAAAAAAEEAAVDDVVVDSVDKHKATKNSKRTQQKKSHP